MFSKRCNHEHQRKLICQRTPELKWYLVECEDCGKMNIQHIDDKKNKAYLTGKKVYPYAWFTPEKMPSLGRRLLVIYEIETQGTIITHNT